jgi:CubicO group peptidase (beta-lactamase class C family)
VLYTQLLESAIGTSGLTGASFAYWDGSQLHTSVAGRRNSVTGDPVTTDTVMHIGSITKVLNTTLMMQLVDEGRIALEDPVVKHVPALRLKDMAALRRITCAMLVNHTSGIDGGIFPDHGPDAERIVDAIARFADLGQLHAPGEGPSYSNVATVIAGYLTQELRGASWYSLVKTRIFEPLGMRHALAHFTELPRFRHSIGDLTDPATGTTTQTSRPFLAASFAPCGTTLMMSAADLVTFARTLLNGGLAPSGARILSPASAAQMAQPSAAILDRDGCYWGLGWMLLPGGLLHHAGGGPGVYSVLYAHPESGCALALLTNCDRLGVLEGTLLDPILKSWTGGMESGGARGEDIDFDPSAYEGQYEGGLFRVEVFSREKALSLRLRRKTSNYDNVPPGGTYPAIALQPLGSHTFSGAPPMPGTPDMELRFVHPDNEGRMQGLAFMLGLHVRKS